MSAARRLTLAALVVAALAGGARPDGASAQEVVELEQVEELTRLGRTEEARALLVAWWEESRDDATRRDRQRALWLRGRLTVDPSQAALDFRRLTVQYPGGPFSGRALLRLAQGAWAVGDGEVADAYVQRLARDYPGSLEAREARSWLERAGPAPEPPPGRAQAEPEEAVASPSPAPGAGPDTAVAAPPEEEAGPVESFAVQLGAFAQEARARALRDRMAAQGYEVRLVRVEGSDLVRVRLGRFGTLEAAEELLDTVQARGVTAALVRDAHREETVR